MSRYDQKSRCSSGKPISFRWFGYPSAEVGLDLDIASEKFLESITTPNRDLNEYIITMIASEFRQRIQVAQMGKLIPDRHIKPVDIRNPPPLYEIRWQGITVRERDPDGNFVEKRLLLRMYHSEPIEVPGYFIGHHIHEKEITGSAEIWLLQNAEIATAVGYYQIGKPTRWGLQVDFPRD